MGDEETESMRRKKLDEQRRAAESRNAEEQIKATLRIMLDDGAYARMINVKLAKPQLFLTAAQNIMALYKQAGRKITEGELVFLLQRIREKSEKETQITFHRK